jgi:hypothetical protein
MRGEPGHRLSALDGTDAIRVPAGPPPGRNGADAAPASATAGLARGILRIGLVLVAALDAVLLLRVVEAACRLSQPGDAEPEAFVPRLGVWSGIAADAGLAALPAILAATGALALASLLVVVRGASPRATATVGTLALSAAMLASPEAVRGMFGAAAAGLLAIGLRVVLAALLAALAWRWVEELALAAALAPRIDPHEIDAVTDREAAEDARKGPGGRDGAARRLDEVLSERVEGPRGRSTRDSDPGFLGSGSPIPPTLGAE